MRRGWQFLIIIDQALNVILGSGWADETLSAYAYRRAGWRMRVVNGLFFWQNNHCLDAYLSEMMRRHLPPEYRTP